ncbi:dynein regulatory complex protein 8-like [Physella acuta]|uniref:dynein regulatory complex protein 8-like n=1 Tax=Physella acuta TaxID=109671 RepID=UPI0027DCD71F|nr:dynein regulatory complex protein 8-like [Physella acuta]XP_059176437.1 dynein regulatory complex protein 8-like [Physella acuta]
MDSSKSVVKALEARETDGHAQNVDDANLNENKPKGKSQKKKGRKKADSKSKKKPTEVKFASIQNKIQEVFRIYDPDETGFLPARNFGGLVQALHCVPTNNQLEDMIESVLDEKQSESFSYEKFLKMMTKVLMTDRYHSATKEEIRTALQILDTEGKGYFTPDEITAFMTESGEPFTPDEVTDMLKQVVDPELNTLVLDQYVDLLVVDEFTY